MSKQTDLINIPDAITVSGSNVGIGTTSPNAPLTVIGGTNTAPSIQLKGGVYANDNASIYSLYSLKLKADSFESITGRTISFDVGTTNAMAIDSSGRVTTPNQPMFSAHGGAEQTSDAREVLQFTSANSNVGNHFSTSTYTFTAPVSGHYHFSFNLMAYAAENSRCQFAKNGSLIADQFYTEADGYAEYPRNSGSIIVQLSTNDTLRVDRNVQNSASERCHQNYRSFTGYLLG